MVADEARLVICPSAATARDLASTGDFAGRVCVVPWGLTWFRSTPHLAPRGIGAQPDLAVVPERLAELGRAVEQEGVGDRHPGVTPHLVHFGSASRYEYTRRAGIRMWLRAPRAVGRYEATKWWVVGPSSVQWIRNSNIESQVEFPS